MLLEKGKLSGFQMSILTLGFAFGSSVILTPGGGAGHDAWIANTLGLMEGLLIGFIFTFLARRFKGKTIVEINSLVYGNIPGKIISVLFIWYLFHLGALVLNNYVRFFNLQLYPATPKTVILLLFTLVCASTVRRGIEVLARCSMVLAPLTVLVIFLNTLMLIPNMDLTNLLPVMDVPIGKILSTAHSSASFPFGETVAFLMLLAFLDKPQHGPVAVSKGILVAGLVFIIIAIRNISVLGPMAAAFNYPSYMATQQINVGEVFTRVEVMVALNLISMGFIKISTLFYGTVLGLAQVFSLRSYQPLILPVGILMVILGLTNVRNTIEMFDFAVNIYPIYAIPFQIGIPLLTLIIAKFRKLPQK